MSENKTSRYFKYAIGEIILVVIGILIALQINNWNENRKTKQDEILILTQLNSDLKKNLEEIMEIRRDIGISVFNSEKLLQFLNSKSTATDSISTWLKRMNKNPIFNNANTAYKNIENSSNNIISNDSLRMKITLMYEKEFKNIHYREDINIRIYLPEFKKQQRENFTLTTELSKNKKEMMYRYDKPLSIVALKTNNLYKNALVDIYNFRNIRLQFLAMTTDRLKGLIKEIDQEIENLN